MKTDLLKMVEHGGCSSKIPPGQLEEILKYLPMPADKNILVGIDTHDDAGVYQISDSLALVLTTDFFPPVCSDPYEFGQIAATNSISDVYAMGGDPVLALNIMMFPSTRLPMQAYADIIKGGFDKASEAGVRILGGHTIDDSPPKYGLAVIGFVHPDRIITNADAVPGDRLVLTKPLGTGIISSGYRLGMATDSQFEKSRQHMKFLNKNGADVMRKYRIRGATDVTGFGLAGHALKMARASDVTIRLNLKNVPLIDGVYGLTDDGCIPGASFRNLDYTEQYMITSADIDNNLKMIAFDAQTSGGLLMCVPEVNIGGVLNDLHISGHPEAAVIGTVEEKGEKLLKIEN